ncbi:MAG: FAD-dependent thymidylate synthase [Oscillospiraceae bacterium]
MKVYLLAYTGSPEKIVASAAKLCYSNSEVPALLDGLTEEKAREFVDMLSTLGHQSPIEHASFTFGIEGVSRSLLAQLTRHRIASYSVQSQRYVRLKDFKYVIPPEIAGDDRALLLYEEAMRRDAETYCELTEILKKKHIKKYLDIGLSEKAATSKAIRDSIEDARFVLPNACETKLVMTMNARELQNFFKQRCCNRAQWEIRALADEILKLCYSVAPSLFKMSGPPCVSGACTEGKMSCGKSAEVQKHCARLKGETQCTEN